MENNWKEVAKSLLPNEFNKFLKVKGTGRKPTSVNFVDISTDIMRRDLTINALFYDIETGEIVDLVGGVNDLKNGVVRTVGAPEARFGEDRLRILRAIRFAARFGSDLDPAVDAALKKDSSLEGISAERIRDEFIKGIQSAKSVKHFLSLIDRYDLFKWVFSGLQINKNFIESKDPVIVIAALLVDDNSQIIIKTLNKLTYTIEEVRGITFLLNLLNLDLKTVLPLKKAQGICGLSENQIRVFGRYFGMDEKLLNAFLQFKLTVSGDELMKKLNLKPGKELGDAIVKAEIENFKKLL